jgi:serine/threonine protein kinase
MNDTKEDAMIPPTLESQYAMLARATRAEEVFGPLPADLAAAGAALKAAYRRFARVVHPDRNPRQAALAGAAFRLLEQWRERAAAELSGAGTVGCILRTRRGSYTVRGALGGGDYFVRYPCVDGRGQPCVLKLASDPANNDPAAREAETLRALAEDEPLAKYLPRVVETFWAEDGAARRRATVFAVRPQAYSLEAIRERFPGGVDPRDAAWMFNRVLEGLALAHAKGVVHGATVPGNVWPVIDTHGVELAEWGYSVNVGDPLKAIGSAYEGWYPPEVFAGRPATAATDIYLAARTLLYLLGVNPLSTAVPGSVPGAMGRLIKACLLPSPHRRPGSAAEVRDHFRDVLRRLYGPPQFRVFAMPVA